VAKDTTYERWMGQEGIPIVRGYGVTDVMGVELGPWERLGGRGAYIQLVGMEGYTGMYLGEIPPGGALEPEKHLYDELIYVVSGRGVTQVWNTDASKSFFEWQTGALFAPPLNTWHRLLNASGTEPARFLAVTSAPMVMDLFHNLAFVFGCRYEFGDRYDGRPDYFAVGERHVRESAWGKTVVWETNFIPDVRGADIDPQEAKGSGLRGTVYEISGNVLAGHMAEWPVGRYQKAHYHIGGAILLIVRSTGYTLMWPKEVGPHPYASGQGDRVVRVDWQEGSVISPPTGWFHQHFNTGAVPARQAAFRYGSRNYRVQFHDDYNGAGSLVSVRKGGTMIEYEDEDPELRRLYQRELALTGTPYDMPEILSIR
jgi:quercetin dioxygenase-like cupin family protein